MDPNLIAANIALFEGDRYAAERHLEAYRRQANHTAADETVLRWLEAQLRTDADAAQATLQTSLELDPNNAHLREALTRFQKLSDELASYSARSAQRRRGLVAAVLILLVLGFGIGFAAFGTTAPPAFTTPPPDSAAQPTAHLIGAAGEWTCLAIEDRMSASELVRQEPLPQRTRVPYSPVFADERLYGMQFDFRCTQLSGCANPPEANPRLVVSAADGQQADISPLPDVFKADESTFARVTYNGTSRGWLIFAISNAHIPTGLQLCTRPTDTDATSRCETFSLDDYLNEVCGNG